MFMQSTTLFLLFRIGQRSRIMSVPNKSSAHTACIYPENLRETNSQNLEKTRGNPTSPLLPREAVTLLVICHRESGHFKARTEITFFSPNYLGFIIKHLIFLPKQP